MLTDGFVTVQQLQKWIEDEFFARVPKDETLSIQLGLAIEECFGPPNTLLRIDHMPEMGNVRIRPPAPPPK
jgi:hypothetical protein